MPTATWANSGGDFLTTNMNTFSSGGSVGAASPDWDTATAAWLATNNENGDTGTVSMAGDGGVGPNAEFADMNVLVQLEDDSSIDPLATCNTIRLRFDWAITNGPMGTATAESEFITAWTTENHGAGSATGTYDESTDGVTFGTPTMGDVFFFFGDPGGIAGLGFQNYNCFYTAGTFSVHNRRLAISNFQIIINYGSAPVVTDVDPTHGDAYGNTVVTITGTDFTGATSVLFGATAAQSFTVDSDTQISAVSPAHAVGQVTVSVS